MKKHPKNGWLFVINYKNMNKYKVRIWDIRMKLLNYNKK